MPPKKPYLAAPRRAVAMGSHQILFSSPIERGAGAAAPRGPASWATDTAPSAGRTAHAKGRSASIGRPALAPSPPPPRACTYEPISAADADGWRPPASSGGNAVPMDGPQRLSAARVARQLRNERAAVELPLRPETPLELQRPATDRSREDFLKGARLGRGAGQRRTSDRGGLAPAPLRPTGGRLSSLSPSAGSPCGSPPSGVLAVDARGGSAGAAAPTAAAFDPETFSDRWRGAAGQPREQLALVRALERWLQDARGGLRAEWRAQFSASLAGAVANFPRSAVAAREAPSVDALVLPESTAVGVVLCALLLRTAPATPARAPFMLSDDGDSTLALSVVRLLRLSTSGSTSSALPILPAPFTAGAAQEGECVAHWLQQQQPVLVALLALAGSVQAFERQPLVLADALAVLRNIVESVSADVTDEALTTEDAAQPLLRELVAAGAIPTMNVVLSRLLAGMEEDGAPPSWLTQALSCACLVLRVLSSHYARQMEASGSLPLLLDVLERAAASTDVVTAVARVLAKLLFDDTCLREMRRSTRLLSVSLLALDTQLSQESADLATTRSGPQEQQRRLMVARLCSAVALVAEGDAAQQQFLGQHGTTVLLALLRRWLPTADEEIVGASSESARWAVVQSVVWLVGVSAMDVTSDASIGGRSSSYTLVLEASTLLTQFLYMLSLGGKQVSSCTRPRRLATMYALMCMSNLSFYYPTIEGSEGGGAYLSELYASLGMAMAWFLVDGEVEGAVEATRVLGNMSYTNAGRDWMEQNKCDEVVVLFLGHEDLRVAYNAFGIILNLTAATSCRLVEDPVLLQMLLQYTGRFTARDGIQRAAAVGSRSVLHAQQEQDQERQQQLLASTPASSSPAQAAAAAMTVAQDYAEQIADLVEKCLCNVRGLMHNAAALPVSPDGVEDERKRDVP